MNSFSVLVVEDDVELRSTLATVLENNRFVVRSAVDGVNALEIIHSKRPDLVLLDVNMPRLNGLERLKQIKEYDPSIIVIIMTAYSTIADAV